MTTICSILADSAAEHPDKPLFVFPETRWRSEETLTYADLAVRSGAAAKVVSDVARPGDRALLLFPTGAEFWEAFFGCLSAGVLAAPLKTPNVNRTSEALAHVINDCQPSLILCDESTADLLKRRFDQHPYLADLPVAAPADWRGHSANFSDGTGRQGTAYLQYTSGSTSSPKGGQVSHENLLANLAFIDDRMGLRPAEDSTVTWLPHYHDMGLVGSYLSTIFGRSTAWCLPPEEFVLRPARWLQLMCEHSATIAGGPNFAYRLCTERVSDEDLSGVDLSHWRVAFVGAERVQPETLRNFAERFAPVGFCESSLFPCYGLGEATLLVTGGPAERLPVTRTVSRKALLIHQVVRPENAEDELSLCGCGQVAAGCDVAIVDPASSERLGDEQIGEVLVTGPSVISGYFEGNRSIDQPFQTLPSDAANRRWLKTGDLGFLAAGELFITGRLKEMMIVRGRNLFPEDVEAAVSEADDRLQAGRCVAFSTEVDGDEALILAAELRREAMKLEDPETVFRVLRERIASAFGVNAYEIVLLSPATIPVTSSGKPQRFAIRDSYQHGTLKWLFRERPDLAGEAMKR